MQLEELDTSPAKTSQLYNIRQVFQKSLVVWKDWSSVLVQMAMFF